VKRRHFFGAGAGCSKECSEIRRIAQPFATRWSLWSGRRAPCKARSGHERSVNNDQSDQPNLLPTLTGQSSGTPEVPSEAANRGETAPAGRPG
jgi:hypothetical protein